MRYILIAISVALTACATPKPAPPPPAPSAACLPVRSYSPADDAALRAALDALPDTSPLVGAMGDYKALRDAARAACAASAPQAANDHASPLQGFSFDWPSPMPA